MDPFAEMLAYEPFIINDGALATQLEARGADINDDLWSAKLIYESPETIKAVHKSYYEAGADIGTSASYQASVEGFMRKGFSEEEARELIVRSVGILKEAVSEYRAESGSSRKLIAAASVGPYGAYLADGSEYTGAYADVDRETIRSFHRERMELLKQGGADVFACETIPALWEAKIIAEEARTLGVPVWVSFSCRDGEHTCDGTPISECARELVEDPNVIAIGSNCTKPEYMASLIRCIVEEIGDAKPVIVFPNGGEEYDPVSKTWSGCACAEDFKEHAREWFEAGARIIGGCCRTTPENIAELAELREELRAR